MRKHLWFWITLLLAAAALVGSALLLVDYVRPAPVFCGAEGGCGVVKRTSFAYPLGIPMPVIGISGILAIAVAAFVPGRAARLTQAALATVGGIVALGLLGVQAKMHVVCPFCAVVDGAVVLIAALSIARLLLVVWEPPAHRRAAITGAMVLLLALGLPLAIGFSRKPIMEGVPDVIVEELRATPKNKVTVVDFVDFECPFCRMTHTELAPLIEERKTKVRVARKHVPLRMHPHAMDAARAGCCGEVLGKGDELADALFGADPAELTPEGCEKLAVQLGLDPDRFRACFKDPATEERIKKDIETFRAAHGHGLPTIWIDKTKLEGAQDKETLASTLDSAINAL
jgi:uncharacterized membrane protein